MQEQKIKKKDLQFAKRLKRLRKQAHLTQEELAARTHLSTTFIGLLEIGQRRPSLKTLQKIATVLGIKGKDLLPF